MRAQAREQPTAGDERAQRRVLAAILLAGLVIRLLLTPFGVFEGDRDAFGAWAARLVETPLTRFYAEPAGGPLFVPDHLPGDLWLLWGIGHLHRLFSPEIEPSRFGFVFLLKLVPILADTGIALVLFLIARLLAGARGGLVAAGGWAFNPAAIFVSATWGQWDAVSALVVLLALWLVVRGTPEWSLPALTYACLIKPQFALLLPLLAIAWWRAPRPEGLARRLDRLGVAMAGSAGVFLAVCLPFSVGLWPLPVHWTIVERARFAAERYHLVTLNADNLWGLLVGVRPVVDDRRSALFGLSYQTWGVVMLLATLALVYALYWRRPTAETLVWATLALTFSMFMLPTRIHERYLLPAVALAVLAGAIAPAARWLAVALSLTCFLNVVLVFRLETLPIFGRGTSSYPTVSRAISGVNVALWLVAIVIFIALATGSPHPRPSPVPTGEGKDARPRRSIPSSGAREKGAKE